MVSDNKVYELFALGDCGMTSINYSLAHSYMNSFTMVCVLVVQ